VRRVLLQQETGHRSSGFTAPQGRAPKAYFILYLFVGYKEYNRNRGVSTKKLGKFKFAKFTFVIDCLYFGSRTVGEAQLKAIRVRRRMRKQMIHMTDPLRTIERIETLGKCSMHVISSRNYSIVLGM